MTTPATPVPTDTPADSTQQKRPFTEAITDTVIKRPQPRSSIKQATDHLLDENRTGSFVHQPNKKRHYVTIRGEDMLNSLVELYTSFFKQRWNLFARSVEKLPLTGTHATNHYQLLAHVYLSHWTFDVYRQIRESLFSLDPVAFNEKYFNQVPVHSVSYDPFLTTVSDHLKPTHITLSYADEVFIPILSSKLEDAKTNYFAWSRFHIDHDLFSLILQVLEEKKVTPLTPLSSDLFGRPSWLFDWSQDQTAFAWFPQEANYNDDDVTIAYIIGVSCSPKLGHADFDEWKITTEPPNFTTTKLKNYPRVIPRRWKSSAEFRVAQVEAISIPLFTEKDKAKFAATNTGPLKVYTNVFKSVEEGTSSQAAEEEVSETDPDYVPASPRAIVTRSSTTEAIPAHRVRVIDYMYYRQVISYFDSASRFTAFKLITKY
nr:putative CP [Rhodiola cryptic virus 1]